MPKTCFGIDTIGGMASFDRQESDAEVQQAMQLVLQSKDRFEGLGDLEQVSPRSILALDSVHTAYEPLGSQVVGLRNVALDNLELLFSSMLGTPEEQAEGTAPRAMAARPFGHYPPIRAAIEAGATARWLIQAETKHTRVLRALQLSYRAARDRQSLAEAMGAPASVRAAEAKRAAMVIARLNELKDTIGVLRQRQLGNPPKYTEILKKASAPWSPSHRTVAVSTPYAIWKISSAFLHGSPHITRAMSDVRQVSEFADGTAQFALTPNLATIAVSISATIELLELVDARYRHLATHDYAGRLVSFPLQ